VEWFNASWTLFGVILAFIGTLAALIQKTFSAERDRQALKNVELERQKLELEVKKLRNEPSVVADRRAIYERLRNIVAEITRDAAATRQHIFDLHEVRHDAEFRFPPDIVNSIRDFLHAVVGLHVSGAVLAAGPGRAGTEDWGKHVQDNHDALTQIATFEQDMVAIFRPHLSL